MKNNLIYTNTYAITVDFMSKLLDNNYMSPSLSNVFSSSAKFEILMLLSKRETSLPLRHISYLTGLPVRSVENALQAFSSQKILRKQKDKRLSLFSLNWDHPQALLFKEIALTIQEHENQIKQKKLDKKAKHILEFLDSAKTLFEKIKK